MLKKAKKINLKKISNPAGDIIKYLDKKNKNFNKFGEVYFNEIKKGYTKGWNLHKKTYCLITVPLGSVVFTLMDFQMKKKKIFSINRRKPSLLIIPPKVWFKFKSLSEYSIITNFIDQIHNKKESLKRPIIK
jgi:dTDP-4-dehydrorhamnose 3,5-epimerase|tara:strand:- start:308 stop:703 length:396 start_codon:yes stop_codon:yes gene_type:complete